MKKPRMIGGVAVEKIDILQTELDNDLPYWLSPVVRYANTPQARAARKKRYREQWAKRKRGRKTVTRAGPPDEPRDEHGRWTDGGGDDTSSAMDQAKEAKLPVAAHNPKEPMYLRIGGWNPDNPRSGNYATGDIEAGLSVYDLDKDLKAVAPTESEWAEDDLRDRLKGDEPKYLVQGMLVGQGHDGEPLLGNPLNVVGGYSHDGEHTVFEEIDGKLTEVPHSKTSK